MVVVILSYGSEQILLPQVPTQYASCCCQSSLFFYLLSLRSCSRTVATGAYPVCILLRSLRAWVNSRPSTISPMSTAFCVLVFDSSGGLHAVGGVLSIYVLNFIAHALKLCLGTPLGRTYDHFSFWPHLAFARLRSPSLSRSTLARSSLAARGESEGAKKGWAWRPRGPEGSEGSDERPLPPAESPRGNGFWFGGGSRGSAPG